MKFSKKIVSEAERLFGNTNNNEYKSIVEEIKNGNPGVLRLIQESNGYPHRFIDSMIKKHGDNAIHEIKKFLNWQLQVNDVYKDNYYELEWARNHNAGRIQYTPEFIEKVKSVFPNNPEIIELAESNSYTLRRMIDEERSYMNVEGMLKTIEQKGDKNAMEEFISKSKRAKDIYNLYSMCYDEYNNFMQNQSNPTQMGE